MFEMLFKKCIREFQFTSTVFFKNSVRIGVQLIRVLKTTESKAEIDRAHALQMELGHSAGMQRRYISRKD